MDVDALFLFCDGSSKGNPGPAAIGISGQVSGKEIFWIAETIGTATNNVAEWKALIRGMEEAIERGYKSVSANLDSELVVRQFEGKYKAKHPSLVPLLHQARQLSKNFSFFAIQHIPRNQNERADALANLAHTNSIDK